MDRKQFVEQEVGRILTITKPNLVRCEYINEGIEVCRVHCENGHMYNVHIGGDSLSAIVYDVFKAVMYK
jgi:hypothetical protein